MVHRVRLAGFSVALTLHLICVGTLVESSVTAGSETAARIRTILAGERRKWMSFQFDRLRQFGYGFYTF
jgi:hypothetical protein